MLALNRSRASVERMPAALSIANLSLTLGGNTILHDVNAEIAAGEFVGIFGPNGAGKTTLVRAIVNTLRPSSGAITIFGEAPGKASHAIGYMPQSHGGLELTALNARAILEAVAQGEKWGVPWTTRAMRAEVE